MAITGSHVLLYSPEADQLRSALRTLLDGTAVDAGGGWLIFALPPAEVGVHPGDQPHHELSFMCDDIEATVAQLRARGIVFRGEIEPRRFGRAITVALPGGLDILLYEPAHPTAI